MFKRILGEKINATPTGFDAQKLGVDGKIKINMTWVSSSAAWT